MINSKFSDNFENKSHIIRQIFESNPTATNKQIRLIAKQVFGIDVSSQLVIFAIGKQKTRSALSAQKDLMSLAAKYLKEFSDDLGWAFFWLRKAAAA